MLPRSGPTRRKSMTGQESRQPVLVPRQKQSLPLLPSHRYTQSTQNLGIGPSSNVRRGASDEMSSTVHSTHQQTQHDIGHSPPTERTQHKTFGVFSSLRKKERFTSPKYTPPHSLPTIRPNTAPAPRTTASPPPSIVGKWHCCKCRKGHDLHTVSLSAQLLSPLSCTCTHRSCSSCSLTGNVRAFAPMNTVEVVHVSEEHGNTVRFGVVCGTCGVAWRARKVSEEPGLVTRKKSVLQRVSAVPRRLMRGRESQSQPSEKVRKSRSMGNLRSAMKVEDEKEKEVPLVRSVLNLRVLSSEMEKGHGKQAAVATVKFKGLTCTCGAHTTASSLCFQIVDWPVIGVAADEETQSEPEPESETESDSKTEEKSRDEESERGNAGFGSTESDRERGHHTPLIMLKGKVHPNPLKSNPVTVEGVGRRSARIW